MHTTPRVLRASRVLSASGWCIALALAAAAFMLGYHLGYSLLTGV